MTEYFAHEVVLKSAMRFRAPRKRKRKNNWMSRYPKWIFISEKISIRSLFMQKKLNTIGYKLMRKKDLSNRNIFNEF